MSNSDDSNSLYSSDSQSEINPQRRIPMSGSEMESETDSDSLYSMAESEHPFDAAVASTRVATPQSSQASTRLATPQSSEAPTRLATPQSSEAPTRLATPQSSQASTRLATPQSSEEELNDEDHYMGSTPEVSDSEETNPLVSLVEKVDPTLGKKLEEIEQTANLFKCIHSMINTGDTNYIKKMATEGFQGTCLTKFPLECFVHVSNYTSKLTGQQKEIANIILEFWHSKLSNSNIEELINPTTETIKHLKSKHNIVYKRK